MARSSRQYKELIVCVYYEIWMHPSLENMAIPPANILISNISSFTFA